MYFKDYSEAYKDFQEPNIEVSLKNEDSGEIEDKIIIWEYDFDSILSKIPLNEDGVYVALAYHANIDMPWYEMEPNDWTMDHLDESLAQLDNIKDKIDEEEIRDICKDLCRIIKKAIINKKTILVKRN